MVMDYRGLGRVNAARGAGSAKWIHCGIIIGPYLDQHRLDYYYSRLQLLADDANSYYVDILPTSDYRQLPAWRRPSGG